MSGNFISRLCFALPHYCTLKHKSTYLFSMPSTLKVAQSVLQNGFVLLTEAFWSAFPNVTYHSHSAKRRLLQLPLVVLHVGTPQSGVAELYLCEYFPGVNYRHFLHLLNAFHTEKSSQSITFYKQHLKDVWILHKMSEKGSAYNAVCCLGIVSYWGTKALWLSGLCMFQGQLKKLKLFVQQFTVSPKHRKG